MVIEQEMRRANADGGGERNSRMMAGGKCRVVIAGI